MKKSLTKLIASCAAVAAVSTAMAISASAATYDAETKVVTPGITSAAADGAQATILVYKADSAETEATAETILYIDQAAKTADLWNTLSLDLADGKYVIKMGGEAAAVASEVLSVGEAATVKALMGDVNLNGEANGADASIIMRAFVGNEAATAVINKSEAAKIVADVNKNGEANGADASIVMRAFVGNEAAKAYIVEVDVPAAE